MKKIYLLFFSLSVVVGYAQNVKVTKETVRLKGEAAEGFEVQLDGTYGEVESQLNKYLKAIGKSKKSEDAYAYALPVINGKNYTSPVYAVVRDKGKGAAWLGIRPTEWPGDTKEVSKDLERMVYDFAVNFYKDKIQNQIDESMRALQAVERQQQRLTNQEKDFTNRLTDNKNEKLQLEKSLENNKLQFESLTKKLAQNKKDQDSIAVATEQIKKVIEMQKQKQASVN
jgi:predicted RNase H-like nuclease (RuvC/YqgF family)